MGAACYSALTVPIIALCEKVLSVRILFTKHSQIKDQINVFHSELQTHEITYSVLKNIGSLMVLGQFRSMLLNINY